MSVERSAETPCEDCQRLPCICLSPSGDARPSNQRGEIERLVREYGAAMLRCGALNDDDSESVHDAANARAASAKKALLDRLAPETAAVPPAIYGSLTARDPNDVAQTLWTRTGHWRPAVETTTSHKSDLIGDKGSDMRPSAWASTQRVDEPVITAERRAQMLPAVAALYDVPLYQRAVNGDEPCHLSTSGETSTQTAENGDE